MSAQKLDYLRRPFTRLTEARRNESLRATLADAPDADRVWVFAYGSLIWNPCFAYVKRRTGTLYGYRRRFCVLSARARGTPDVPGLGLGLEPSDDDCLGIVYCLNSEAIESDLVGLWKREMSSGIYQPHWLTISTEQGEVKAITFVVDQTHPLYAGDLSQHEMVEIITQASGKYGPCRDYLINTVQSLATLGINEPEFHALVAQVNNHK